MLDRVGYNRKIQLMPRCVTVNVHSVGLTYVASKYIYIYLLYILAYIYNIYTAVLWTGLKAL